MNQENKSESLLPTWLAAPIERFIRGVGSFGLFLFIIYIVFSISSAILVRIGNAQFSKGNEILGTISYRLALEFKSGLKNAVKQCYDDLEKQQYDLAVEHCSKAIHINPYFALAYAHRGLAYAELQQYDHAITDFTKDIELIPVATRSYINRGNVYMEMNSYDLAIADFTKSIEINPKEQQAWLARGLTHALQGKNDLAIADCKKALELDNNYWNAYFCLGRAYASQENYDLAITHYDKAIDIDSQKSILYLSRGKVFAMQNNYESAISDFNNVIKLAPESIDAYTWRGNMFADTKEFAQAIADYKKALELSTDDGQSSYIYCVQGVTYVKMNEFDSAIASLEQGVKLNAASENDWCKSALENARQEIPVPLCRRLTQRALDWQVCAAFSGSFLCLKPVPLKWRYLVPPASK